MVWYEPEHEAECEIITPLLVWLKFNGLETPHIQTKESPPGDSEQAVSRNTHFISEVANPLPQIGTLNFL